MSRQETGQVVPQELLELPEDMGKKISELIAQVPGFQSEAAGIALRLLAEKSFGMGAREGIKHSVSTIEKSRRIPSPEIVARRIFAKLFGRGKNG